MNTAEPASTFLLAHPSRWPSAASDLVGGPARLRIVALLAAVLALSSADVATIGSMAASLEHGLHVGNTEVGLLVTLATAVTAVATLPMGALADRVNRTRLLYWGVLAWSAMMVLNGLSVSFTMLLITRLGLGIVMAVGGPVVASLTGDWFPVSERARIYGFVLTGELAGAGVGYVMSGQIATALSWRFSFWVLALLGLLLAAFVAGAPEPARGGASRLSVGAVEYAGATRPRRRRRGQPLASTHATAPDDARPSETISEVADRPEHDDDPLAAALAESSVRPDPEPARRLARAETMWESIRAILTIRTNVTLIVASSLGYFFFSGIETFGSLFMQVRFGVPEGLAGLLLIVVGAGAVAGVLSGGRIADAVLRRGYIPARPVVAGVAFAVCAALFVPALLVTSLAVFIPVVAVAAAGLGATNPPLDAARLDLISDRMWGRAEAVRTVFRSAFQAVAPLLFGYLSAVFGERTSGLGQPATSGDSTHGQGLAHVFLIMLAPMLLAALILVLSARRTYPRDVATELHAELLGRGSDTQAEPAPEPAQAGSAVASRNPTRPQPAGSAHP